MFPRRRFEPLILADGVSMICEWCGHGNWPGEQRREIRQWGAYEDAWVCSRCFFGTPDPTRSEGAP